MFSEKPGTTIIRQAVLFIHLIFFCNISFSQQSEFQYKRKNHSTSQGYISASKQSKYIAGGIGVNFQSYFGDLTPNENFVGNALKTMRPGFSMFALYNFDPWFYFSAEFTFSRITGDDFNSEPYESSISARKYRSQTICV